MKFKMAKIFSVSLVACILAVLGTATSSHTHSKTNAYMAEIEDYFQMKSEVRCTEKASTKEAEGAGPMRSVAMHQFNNDPFSRKVAVGKSIWAFDALDPLVEESFKSEIQETWDFFTSQSEEGDNPYYPDGNKPQLSAKDQEKMVGYEKLKAAMMKGNWIVSKSALVMNRGDMFMKAMDQFDENGNHFLAFRELALMAVEKMSTGASAGCTHCLLDTRKKLSSLFQYIDCDQDGFISAEDLWDAFGVMQTFKLNSTANTNDLLLNCDKDQDSMLNRVEFVEGILHGYWERMVGSNGLTDRYKAMKELRKNQYQKRREAEKTRITKSGIDFRLK